MPRPCDVGVGTAVLILNEHNEILLGQRKGAHRAGFWCAPGGWLDRADTQVVEAAIREVHEETGVKVVTAYRLLWTTEDHPELQVRTVTLYYVARKWCGSPRVMEPDKCEAWSWFASDDLPSPLFPGLAEALSLLAWNVA